MHRLLYDSGLFSGHEAAVTNLRVKLPSCSQYWAHPKQDHWL